MRVLVVHDEPLESGYGAESYVRRLVSGLRTAGDAVEVLAGERRHRGASKLLDLWDPLARRLVTERARRFRPDVIHHHNIARELSASVLAAAPTVPAVMTVHDQRILGAREHGRRSPRGFIETVGARAVSHAARRHLAATIGVSDRLSEMLRAAEFPAVSTVPVPAADSVAPTRPAEDCHDVAVVARLAADKGLDTAIAAFRILGADAGRSRLLIAGDGPLRAELAREAAPLGDRVEFQGRLDEGAVSALLGRVRLVVVASIPGRRPEGSSLAVVEAAAHGRPVIGTDDPAVAEVLGRTGAGDVVPAGDPQALADAIRRYLGDDSLVASVAARGRQGAQAHSIAAVTRATREVYRSASGAGIDG